MCKYPISNSQYSISFRHRWILHTAYWIMDTGYWIIAHLHISISPARARDETRIAFVCFFILYSFRLPPQDAFRPHVHGRTHGVPETLHAIPTQNRSLMRNGPRSRTPLRHASLNSEVFASRTSPVLALIASILYFPSEILFLQTIVSSSAQTYVTNRSSATKSGCVLESRT